MAGRAVFGTGQARLPARAPCAEAFRSSAEREASPTADVSEAGPYVRRLFQRRGVTRKKRRRTPPIKTDRT